MSVRIVLLAEGPGELRGERLENLPEAAPLERLMEEELGVGHILVRRAIAEAASAPPDAIHFQQPLRLKGGRLARGSDLHHPKRVRQLMRYGLKAPDLTIVLVDGDGQGESRRTQLEAGLKGSTAIVAVAVQEFESWLVADAGALTQLDLPSAPSRSPDALPPTAAKAWVAEHVGSRRADLARAIDLDTLVKVSPSFDRFVRDLRRQWA